MKVKILNIEIEFDSDEENFNINIKYGNILDNEDFKDLKEDTLKLQDEIIKIIRNHIEGD